MKIFVTGLTDSGMYRVRKELIIALLRNGHEVVVSTPASNVYPQIEQLGCTFIPIDIDAHGQNPFKELMIIRRYGKILKQVNPDLVLSFTMKPNLYCGINCRMLGILQIMNITGFGTVLASPGVMQKFLVNFYRIVAKNVAMIFFQNTYNLGQFKDWHIASEKQYYLLPGSGVNLVQYRLCQYPKDSDGIHFLFISRILKEKGIDNYLEAAKSIHERHPNTIFHILGQATGVYKRLIEDAHKKGYVINHGRVNNIASFQKMSHCTILPSYYPEGICNVLLEAAASGRPVITCDHPGCRETVENGKTGYLVKPNDTDDLIDKIEMFLSLSNSERAQMGLLGRKKMEDEFDREIVVKAYLDIIRQIGK
jgi:galacturonosyltransferase